ncbi:MAG: ferritin-like domain-containing protein [Moraxellaceae bacterium]|nr:ferritin-like domain-containing protein [Moraxellaceae bacterium]
MSHVVIEHREQLLFQLAEAAEVEHCLMCTYLYAAFTLKGADATDLDDTEREAVQRWRKVLIAVAIEEMSHLTLVGNLMVALGGGPQLDRANLPLTVGYFPAGVQAVLAPFCEHTMDHFVFLERPENTPDADWSVFPHDSYSRGVVHGRVMPNTFDYATVGELYRSILQGIETLYERVGEDACFPGRSASQIGPLDAALPGLRSITTLEDARQAIDTIVRQGEGAATACERSHYMRFIGVREELAKLRARRADFEPSRPAALNPVMRKPPMPEGRVWVTHPQAVLVMDYANALYAFMLRLLMQAWGRPPALASAKGMLVQASIRVMRAMTPVAEYLTTLPACEDQPGVNAGISFATLRNVVALPFGSAEWRMLGERADELAQRGRELTSQHALFADVAKLLDSMAAELLAREQEATPVAAAPVPTAPTATSSAPVEASGIEVAEGKQVTLYFEGKRCIHARHCVLSQPKVFKANTPGTWIFPDEARPDDLAALAQNCPSGAIQYRRHDDGPDEPAPAVNTLRVRENGPLAIHAPITLGDQAIGYRATLCRCGASQNKPFCDGSHNDAGFKASGEPASLDTPTLTQRHGALSVRPQANGPLKLSGNLEICCGTGRTIARVEHATLCRCGGSANKPFCDGTHARNGFAAVGD